MKSMKSFDWENNTPSIYTWFPDVAGDVADAVVGVVDIVIPFVIVNPPVVKDAQICTAT